jgi:hypothetical protein
MAGSGEFNARPVTVSALVSSPCPPKASRPCLAQIAPHPWPNRCDVGLRREEKAIGGNGIPPLKECCSFDIVSASPSMRMEQGKADGLGGRYDEEYVHK